MRQCKTKLWSLPMVIDAAATDADRNSTTAATDMISQVLLDALLLLLQVLSSFSGSRQVHNALMLECISVEPESWLLQMLQEAQQGLVTARLSGCGA